MEVSFHRFILSEFNTHRVFSRNSASSRAIPIEKQISRILEDLAYPVEFGSKKAGMQAGPPLTGFKLWRARRIWKKSSQKSVRSAKKLAKLGVHKQVTNRILEPYMWHTVIVTSTEWNNFFAQRCSGLAQPEIRAIAETMRIAYLNSTPKLLLADEWHTPYVTPEDYVELGGDKSKLVKISIARCARVSYLTHDGKRDVAKDLNLYDKLVSAEPPHWSPLEHVATPFTPFTDESVVLSHAGNFEGFAQLRHNLHLI